MKYLALLCGLWLFAPALPGQSQSAALIEAFSTSYVAEAEADFAAAIAALTPHYDAQSYALNLRLGWLYYNQGDYPQSKSYYRKAMQLLPYSVEAKFGFVLPESALGNWSSVEAVYEEILKIDPKNTRAHYWLGALYYEQQRYDAAYRHLEIVVNLYPFDYDATVLFGWVHLQQGKVAKAKVLFEKALLIDPTSTSAREGLALLE
jgi:tetratricopeptide (TPR) repeat protein